MRSRVVRFEESSSKFDAIVRKRRVAVKSNSFSDAHRIDGSHNTLGDDVFTFSKRE